MGIECILNTYINKNCKSFIFILFIYDETKLFNIHNFIPFACFYFFLTGPNVMAQLKFSDADNGSLKQQQYKTHALNTKPYAKFM